MPAPNDGPSLARFQPAPPARMATVQPEAATLTPAAFQPAPPARRATEPARRVHARDHISTRAPRTEGDRRWRWGRRQPHYFNPRPPHGGRPQRAARPLDSQYFNPRPPHGGRPVRADDFLVRTVFQPAPPARRATVSRRSDAPAADISTRAPRTEGDLSSNESPWRNAYFNPRPPHGGRHFARVSRSSHWLFQPAPPARRATRSRGSAGRSGTISTRAPRTEGDTASWTRPTASRNFNPRPPHGGRHAAPPEDTPVNRFQPAPPARRATRRPFGSTCRSTYFNPRPPHGGRHGARTGFEFARGLFQPAPPARRATCPPGRSGRP